MFFFENKKKTCAHLNYYAQKAKNKIAERYQHEIHNNYCLQPRENRSHILQKPFIQKGFTIYFPVYIFRKQMIDGFVFDSKLHDYFELKTIEYKLQYSVNNRNEKWILNQHLCGALGVTTMNEYIEKSIDYEWIYKQNVYIKNLPLRCIYIVYAYSINTYKILNEFHTNTITEVDFYRDFQIDDFLFLRR